MIGCKIYLARISSEYIQIVNPDIFGMHTHATNDALSNGTKVIDLVTLTVTFMLKIAFYKLCCHQDLGAYCLDFQQE